MSQTEISVIRGREILDSRGNPTVEAEVILEGGALRSEEHTSELQSPC